jgi:hypothetical protein
MVQSLGWGRRLTRWRWEITRQLNGFPPYFSDSYYFFFGLIPFHSLHFPAVPLFFRNMLNIILSFIGWSILPNLITRILLIFLTRLYILPAPQSQLTHVVSYRVVFALVVFSYLLYTLITAFLSTPQNYYQQLGVMPSVDDTALRAAYRFWVRKNHPDKRGGAPDAAEAFRKVQEGFEVLKDPVLRFAYDRCVSFSFFALSPGA